MLVRTNMHYSEIANKAIELSASGKLIVIVDYYNVIKEIFRYIMRNSHINIESVELADPNFDGYDREFILTIDSNRNLWVEKAYFEGKYLRYDADIVFINHGANVLALSLLEPADVVQYSVLNE